MTRASFYFDLGSPFAYLTAERIGDVLAEPVAWRPVSLGGLFKLTGRSSWSLESPERRRAGIAEVERRARLYGLPPVRWPEEWPSDYLFAMRVATYAFGEGRGREFTLRAFRLAFQEGEDLAIPGVGCNAAGLSVHFVPCHSEKANCCGCDSEEPCS